MALTAAGSATTREAPTLANMLGEIVPENPIRAMAEDKVLSVIFFSLVLGAAITAVGEKATPLRRFFEALNAVMMRITDWIMLLAPIGVFALMATMVGRLGTATFKSLGVYMAAVLSGLGVHAFVTLPLLLLIFGKYPPWRLFRDMFTALGTAFSTASSAATLPLTIACVEENAGVPSKTAGFVLPLGATMNMDGTALYEAVAAIFIANAYGITLTFAQQATIAIIATLASIGAAAVPSAGLVMMVLVLKAVNLPLEGIALIAGVDRILDMCRTTINVWGDSCGAVVVSRLIDRK
jgi:Na+/H+-dicarboxylate symporter